MYIRITRVALHTICTPLNEITFRVYLTIQMNSDRFDRSTTTCVLFLRWAADDPFTAPRSLQSRPVRVFRRLAQRYLHRHRHSGGYHACKNTQIKHVMNLVRYLSTLYDDSRIHFFKIGFISFDDDVLSVKTWSARARVTKPSRIVCRRSYTLPNRSDPKR